MIIDVATGVALGASLATGVGASAAHAIGALTTKKSTAPVVKIRMVWRAA